MVTVGNLLSGNLFSGALSIIKYSKFSNSPAFNDALKPRSWFALVKLALRAKEIVPSTKIGPLLAEVWLLVNATGWWACTGLICPKKKIERIKIVVEELNKLTQLDMLEFYNKNRKRFVNNCANIYKLKAEAYLELNNFIIENDLI